MHILAAEEPKRGAALALVCESIMQPLAGSRIRSINRIALVLLCCSFFAIGPAYSQSDATAAPTAPPPILPSPVTLPSGTYQGVWRDEGGLSGGAVIELVIDGNSIKGTLKLVGVEDYSGDKIRGRTMDNVDGTLGVEFKTRDGFWKTTAIFDGQLLVGSYDYKFYERRVQQLVRGEWAAQRVPD